MHCSRIHIPVIFFSRRVVPSTPPSFVMFSAAVSSVITGSFTSMPISDQVPELRYANFSSEAGTAAPAEAVS